MKPEEQLKALAELDGFKFHYSGDGYCVRKGEPTYHLPPNYLTSYDAIIPLIQKQDEATREKMRDYFASDCYVFDPTPSQLCEALLRATGRWKE